MNKCVDHLAFLPPGHPGSLFLMSLSFSFGEWFIPFTLYVWVVLAFTYGDGSEIQAWTLFDSKIGSYLSF